MRALSCVVVATLAGCGYPQFAFTASDASESDVPAIVEDSDVDASPIFDAAIDDTGVPDTSAETPADTKPDTPPPTGCKGITADFCVDFDTSTTSADGWNAEDTYVGGSTAIETTSPHSAPKSLFAHTNADSSRSVAATVWKLFTASSIDREARIDAWIRLDGATFTGTQLYLFKYGRDGAGDGLALSIDASGFFLEIVAPGATSPHFSLPVPVGKWFHVRMDAKLKYVGGSVTLWIDDMTTPVFTKTGFPTLETDSLNRRFTVGLYSQNATVDFGAHFDDVSLAWK